MKTTELNTANEIRALSNQDLDAVAGGFVTYAGGGGKVVNNKYAQEGVLVSLGLVGAFLFGSAIFGF
jgi:hypothetical protein